VKGERKVMKMESRGRGSILTGIVCLGLLATGAPAQNQTLAERIAAGQERAQATKRYLEDLLTNARAEHEARRATLPLPQVDPQAAKAAAEAKRVWLRDEILPWLHTDERLPDGQIVDDTVRGAVERAKLSALSESLRQKAERDRTEVQQFLRRTGFAPFTRLEDGRVSAIVSIENGIPRALATCNATAADTVATDELWPGGNTGLNLTGTNVPIGIWDGGDVRITHREFSTNGVRVTDIDGSSILGVSDHATHVAGTLAAYGVTNQARGMAHRARIFASDFLEDASEMPGVVSTNTLRVSNHSYAYQAGWGYTVIGANVYAVWWGDVAINPNQDFHFGFYTTNAQNIDRIAYDAPSYLPVWAAANERGAFESSPLYDPSLALQRQFFLTRFSGCG
jgi:hypothetical protein